MRRLKLRLGLGLAAPSKGGGARFSPAARKFDGAGDSLMEGFGNTDPWKILKMTQDFAGSANVLLSSVNNGAGGTKLATIAAAMISRIASYDAGLMIGGTNDADTGTSLATSTDAIVSVANAYKAANKPLIVITPPPFYDSSPQFNLPAYQAAVKAIRDWEIANAAQYGFFVADLYGAVVDTDGQLKPAYRYGDGVHLNSEAAAVAANLVRSVMAANNLLGVNAVRDRAALNLCPNPGNAGAGALPTGAVQANRTGSATSWTISYANDTDNILVPGNRWLRIAADATAGNGNLQIAFAGASLPNGDRGSFRCKIRITDVNGTTLAAFRANSGYVDFGVGKSNIIQGGEFFSGGSSPYEVDYRYTATSTANHTPFLIINLVTGQNVTVEIGDIGLFDMTANPF